MTQSASEANNRQVGGNHYAGGYQHWDFAEDAELGGHEWMITKYVSRHRRKAGLQDVQKAIHHTEKLMELADQRGRKPKYNMYATGLLSKWVAGQVTSGTPADYADIMVMLGAVTWTSVADLYDIRTKLQSIADGYAVAAAAAEPTKRYVDQDKQPPVALSAEQMAAVDETGATCDPKPYTGSRARLEMYDDPPAPDQQVQQSSD